MLVLLSSGIGLRTYVHTAHTTFPTQCQATMAMPAAITVGLAILARTARLGDKLRGRNRGAAGARHHQHQMESVLMSWVRGVTLAASNQLNRQLHMQSI